MIKSIPSSKIEEFQKTIRNLNKKQAQFGLPLTIAKEIGRHTEAIPFVFHEKGDRPEQDTIKIRKILFIDHEVTNLGIIRNDEGHEYLGTRTKDKSGIIVFCPDKQWHDEVAKDTDFCDHCGTIRKRKQYHVFKKSDGTIIRVGSTCCKEYFGINASAALDMYIKTMTSFSGRSQADFNEDEDIVYNWNEIFKQAQTFTHDFTEWGDQVIDYDIKPTDEDFSKEIAEIKDHWKGEVIANSYFIGRYSQPSTFAPNCDNLMNHEHVASNKLKLAFAVIHFGMNKIREAKKSHELRLARQEEEKKWAESQIGVEQPKYSLGEKVEFEGVIVWSVPLKKEPKSHLIVNCEGVIYDFYTKDEAIINMKVGDRVKIKGVFDWECRFGGKYIYQNIKNAKLVK